MISKNNMEELDIYLKLLSRLENKSIVCFDKEKEIRLLRKAVSDEIDLLNSVSNNNN